MTELPFSVASTPPVVLAQGRRCRRHDFSDRWDEYGPGCGRCKRGRHSECHGCGCPCGDVFEETDAGRRQQLIAARESIGRSVSSDEPWDDRPRCLRCGKPRDEARSRRGRTSRSRGNAIERAWCKRLALRHTGQYGEAADGDNAMFVGQCKSRAPGSFPGWMADELGKLAALRTGKVPILGIIEAAGRNGHAARRLVVMDEADFAALHAGETA